MSAPLLAVDGLTVELPTQDGAVHAVTDLSYDVRRGEALGIIGESGAGKTASVLALLGLLDGARVTGSARLDGEELVGATERTLRRVRGNRVAMVFQDPAAALHPHHPVGRQVAEAYRAHQDVGRRAARARAVEMLERVGLPDAARRARDYPHQLSGGQRQRVMIAMALVNDPDLLIADEPTTALDVTVQAQILALLREVQADTGVTLVLITHDVGVVARATRQLLVMYAGRAVETGPTPALLEEPRMPYTRALLAASPDLAGSVERRLTPVPGAPPSLLHPPSGCPFHPRCDRVDDVPGDRCLTELPDLRRTADGRTRRCHLDPATLRGRDD